MYVCTFGELKLAERNIMCKLYDGKSLGYM